MSTNDPHWEYVQPAPNTIEALRRVFAGAGSAADATIAELIEEERRGRVSFDGLCEARYRDRVVAAVFPQPLPGKAGLLWVSPIRTSIAEEALCRLVRMSLDFFASRQVRLTYALFEDEQPEVETILASCGFQFLATLFYLGCERGEFPTAEPALPLQFEAYSPEAHARLARMVEETYSETLDCPDLKDVRPIEDILEGYRGIGSFSPRRWFLARRGSDDVGCLLLAKHDSQDALELVYMGIAPQFRGKGWGRHVARYAQWIANTSEVSRLLLAVDSVNEPALAMYAAVGFERWDRRRVLCKVLRSNG